MKISSQGKIRSKKIGGQSVSHKGGELIPIFLPGKRGGREGGGGKGGGSSKDLHPIPGTKWSFLQVGTDNSLCHFLTAAPATTQCTAPCHPDKNWVWHKASTRGVLHYANLHVHPKDQAGKNIALQPWSCWTWRDFIVPTTGDEAPAASPSCRNQWDHLLRLFSMSVSQGALLLQFKKNIKFLYYKV